MTSGAQCAQNRCPIVIRNALGLHLRAAHRFVRLARQFSAEIRVHRDGQAVVIINADANATHQSVIHVMEAARAAGLVHITFATQSPAPK